MTADTNTDIVTSPPSIVNVITKDNYKTELQSFNLLFYQIASRVYKELGTGHTEFIYHRAMEIELRSYGVAYETERRVMIRYRDKDGNDYSLGEERIDLYVLNCKTIIELKATVNTPRELEIAQVEKYKRELLKEGIDSTYGIIINFPQPGTKPAKDDIDFYVKKFYKIV